MTEVLDPPLGSADVEAAIFLSDAEKALNESNTARAKEDDALGRKLAEAEDAEEKAIEARLLAGTPVGFTNIVLGIGTYQWQSDVLSWFEDTLELCKASLCTPNGAGKSSVIVASLALWWISVHPQGKVVITTKDSKQLDNQIWPSIERHKDKFPHYDFIERMVRNGTGGFIVGFTTDDPGRAEGWHKINDITGPLLIIEDEAKSIPDAIDRALDRCTYNAKLLTSSPGLTEGFFYRSHREDQAEPPLGYHHMQVGLADCPHIPQSRKDNIIAEYGEAHWFTRSTLYGEFTDADSDTLFVIPKHIPKALIASPPRYVPGGQRAFLDFAAGRAENVLAHKRGNKIELYCWKDVDPMRAVYHFIKLFVQLGLRTSEIMGDAGGMGIPILARFKELGWSIAGKNNESEPLDTVKYPTVGAEDWHNAAIKLAGMNIILPDDPIAIEQLCSRRAAPSTKALLGLETKKEMAKRGVASPDRADGIVGVLAMDVDATSALFDQTGLESLESSARGDVRFEMGNLELTGDVVQYQQAVGGWLTVYEKPIAGFSYICVLNPMRHSEPLLNHTLTVVRAPRWDEQEGALRPARLAAKVQMLPFRLDSGPLAVMVDKLSKWYGGCMVVPIVNERGDVIQKLQEEGVQIYSRPSSNEAGSGFSAHGRLPNRFEFGWETDDFTRSQWIGQLAEQIREQQVIVEDMSTVMQLYQLSGKNSVNMREAEALGVALQLMDYASVYVAQERKLQWGATDGGKPSTANSMIS